jgi:penicillin-insensitive murein endopeptidase
VRLDVPREWLLIKTLLTLPEANVQWMFISTPLEAIITEYARARGEDFELIWHAETVMRQPADSLPHDDHLHLRTACTPEEVAIGCEGGGPYWPWLPALPSDEPDESDDASSSRLLAPIHTESEQAKATFVELLGRRKRARARWPAAGRQAARHAREPPVRGN